MARMALVGGFAAALLSFGCAAKQVDTCSVFCVREASYDHRSGFTIEKIYGTNDTIWVGRETLFGADIVHEAEFVRAPYGGPGILLLLTENGRQQFNAYAEAHHKEAIALYVAGNLLLAPIIMGVAEDEKLLVEGHITESEAKEFVDQLNKAKE